MERKAAPFFALNALLFSTFFSFSFSCTSVNAAPSAEVLRHAPILVSRGDQVNDPYTDRFLFLGYSTIPEHDGSLRVRYTAYFSDEDSVKSKWRAEKHISTYGRRLDVEWIYEVLIDVRGAVKERKYHCPAVAGIGHHTCDFDGNFEQGSDHPILFNVAKHNVFSSRPQLPHGNKNGVVIHLEPTLEIPFPKSRDLLAIENPEYLRMSDEELSGEGKLAALSTEYAYIRIRGDLKGKIQIHLKGAAKPIGVGLLKELGLDLWGKESVIAVRLSTEDMEGLKKGTVPFRFTVSGTNEKNSLRLQEVGLYLVTAATPNVYKTIDLSARIRCGDPKNLSTCEI